MNNPFSLDDKNILVTGASSGIGRGIVLACADMGANLIITGRNKERLSEVSTRISTRKIASIEADLTVDEDLSNLISSIDVNLDGIVCAAGVSDITLIKKISRQKIMSVFEINLFSQVELISQLMKNKKLNRGTSIVLISSMSGNIVGNVGESIYSSSKAALSGYMRSAAVECSGKGYRFNSISPGIIETKLLDLARGYFTEDKIESLKVEYPLKRFGKPEDVAYGAIYLLSNASSWVTGTNLVIDGGFTIK